MPNRNSVEIMGHLGKDPDLREGGSSPYAFLSVATKHFRKGKDPETDWHFVKVMGRDSLKCRELQKGDGVLILDGRLTYSKFKDKNGNDKESTQIHTWKLEGIKRIKVETEQDSAPANNDLDDIPF